MPHRHSLPVIVLHWTVALLMIIAWAIGEQMEDLRGPDKAGLLSWHVLAGLAVAVLLLPRIVARLAGPAPAPLAVPRWQERAARLGHVILYALMLLLPLSGLVSLLYGRGAEVALLGLQIPSLGFDRTLHEAAEEVHGALSKLFLLTLLVHLLAVAFHATVRGENVLGRILPGPR